jgi:hypothetical protein
MNRSSLPVGVSTLKKWYEEKNCLKCTLPYQRHQGMWSNITKSMLIWCILSDSYIPPIVLLKDTDGVDDKGKQQFSYEICDGLQRLSSLFDFMNDSYRLHASTPEVEVESTIYDLAGLFYSDLSDECKDRISGYRFSVQCIENYSSEEAEMLFFNINSGVPLSTIQKSKPRLGEEICIFIREQLEKVFFTQGINLSANQAIKEDDFYLLLASIMLLDDNYSAYKSISMSECLKYAEVLRNTFSGDRKLEIIEVVDYLSGVYTKKEKYLRKNNVPSILILTKQAITDSITADCFKVFLDKFFFNEPDEYKEYSGSGNVKLVNVDGRMRMLKSEYQKYFYMPEKITEEQECKHNRSLEGTPKSFIEREVQDIEENSELLNEGLSLIEDNKSEGSLSETESNEVSADV